MVPQPTVVALTAALAGLAAATPIRTKIGTKNGSFTVNQVANPSFKPHGAFQLAKAYNKYGIPMPQGLAKTVAKYNAAKKAKRDSGSAVTTPEQYDIQYLTPVDIGTPAQTLNLDFDSGSSDLWVFSTETPAGSVHGQTQYDPSGSSSAEQVSGATWSITYGDGSASSGDVYRDVVSVGGVSFAGQAVESAKTVSDQFAQDANNDGLLGLAFSALNTVSPRAEKTFFDNVAGGLDVAAWTADLKYHAAGSYDFGVVDGAKHTGDIAYVDVDDSRGFWGFTADVGGESVSGIADTGTTLALFPDAVVDAYYGQVDGAQQDQDQGGYVFPCDAELPDLTFKPGDASITIPGKYINYAPADESGQTCFGGIQSSTDIGISIYGDIALKAAFVVFDQTQGAPRLGWATKDL
ncbi:putative secreted aspartic proteinase precursor [Rosellinia necatrix]|uniref:Putative secreted aspartic proteinase n=1 Tax=Rosellinia necatrix TaxID=77044 RepID=A0A1W2TIK9_ROSNE|nr:putative secreted aspartic proteinase precursor [Rosellinia necatrix]